MKKGAAAAAWSEIQREANETGQAEPEYDAWSAAREAAWAETHHCPDLEYEAWEAERAEITRSSAAHTDETHSEEPAGEEEEAAYAEEEWQETANDSWPEGAADEWSETAG